MAGEEGTAGRGRWGTAIALSFVVLLLPIFDALPVVLVPLGLLLIGLPGDRSVRWSAIGAALVAAGLLATAGPFPLFSRGWGLILGAVFLLVTLGRPEWSVLPRALASVALAVFGSLLGLFTTGRASAVDAAVTEQFRKGAERIIEFQERLPPDARPPDPAAATAQIVELQAEIFPAVLALESVAALALAAWWVRRLGRSDDESFRLAPMRDFRFSDQLIWVLIVALVGLLVPVGEPIHRLALNGLVFMVALYVLRGLAIFAFLASGSRSRLAYVLGGAALILFYPIALPAALLMGVGDTWLDVRRRGASATPG